jgi:hypothetical protein
MRPPSGSAGSGSHLTGLTSRCHGRWAMGKRLVAEVPPVRSLSAFRKIVAREPSGGYLPNSQLGIAHQQSDWPGLGVFRLGKAEHHEVAIIAVWGGPELRRRGPPRC